MSHLKMPALIFSEKNASMTPSYSFAGTGKSYISCFAGDGF